MGRYHRNLSDHVRVSFSSGMVWLEDVMNLDKLMMIGLDSRECAQLIKYMGERFGEEFVNSRLRASKKSDD